MLFVPGDSPEKLDKALRSGADALILDLEDSVAAAEKGAARRTALAFLQEQRATTVRPRLYVRINALSTPLADGDLDVVMTGAPDGIVLPKATGGADVSLLAARLSLREALHGIDDGATRIIADRDGIRRRDLRPRHLQRRERAARGPRPGARRILPPTPARCDHAIRWRMDRAYPRWCEALPSSALPPRAFAAIDTVSHRFSRSRRAEDANAPPPRAMAFPESSPSTPIRWRSSTTPSRRSPRRSRSAEQIVAAFAEAGDAGVTSLDGKMLDRPHLIAAERLLRASRERSGTGAYDAGCPLRHELRDIRPVALDRRHGRRADVEEARDLFAGP